MLTFY
jgi:hypothetical protein